MALSCGEGGSTGFEIVTQINTNTDAIGDLDTLETEAKDTLVNAINEIEAKDFRQLFYGEKAQDLVVPNAYNATADIEITTPILPAGRYLLSYAFQADFNGNKDKVLNYKTVGDFPSDEFGMVVATAMTAGTKISENYSFYRDLPEGAINLGMVFKDLTGGNGFTIDFVDLMVMWVGYTPTP